MASEDFEAADDPPDDADDARVLGTAIQACIDRLVSRSHSGLQAVVTAAESSEPRGTHLLNAATDGFREAITHYAVDGRSSGAFVLLASKYVRQKCATVVGDQVGGSDGMEEWVRKHLSDNAISQHVRLADVDGHEALDLAIEEIRGLANKLVLRHYQLAKAVARLFSHPGLSQDDLAQEAVVGLRKAALTYSPTNGAPFPAYARTVIRRHLTSVVRTANGATDYFARRIEEFIDTKIRLANDQCREPSDDEVFHALGWAGPKRGNVLSVMRIVSPQDLPTTLMGGSEVAVTSREMEPQVELLRCEAEAAHRNRLAQVTAALARLSSEECQIIKLRYTEGLSFREIGDQLRLTERQVRTRHKGVLEVLEQEIQGSQSDSQSTNSA